MEPHGTTKSDHGQDHDRDRDWALRPTVADDAGGSGRRSRLREVEREPEPEDSDDGSDEGLPVPERLGRFVVLRKLGHGGMGTVLEAYDETLDRKVAVKQLHRDSSGEAGEHHRQRLLREAQALARLSHPNVVQVYDAGEQQGRLYIAMELVAGQTLWEWQKTPHAWAECLRAYMGAGAGLAAAHDQGIVHRDFKPTNCIIDAQGRVKVLDFGLARGVDDIVDEGEAAVPTLDRMEADSGEAGTHVRVGSVAGDERTRLRGEDTVQVGSPRERDRFDDSVAAGPSRKREGSGGSVAAGPSRRREGFGGSVAAGPLRRVSDSAIASGPRRSLAGPEASGAALSVLSLQLTRTGAMLGTPAYMAPEQAAGRPADARSDQFSFCVALYEAIYGERPFAGNIGLAIMTGKVPRFPARSRAGLPAVPPWLRKALQQGMAAEKQQRFASMDELLAALQRGERRRRQLGVAVLAVGVLLGGTAAATLREAPCEGLRQAPMPGWSDDSRAAVETALRATKVEHAWEATAAGLDEYAHAWTEARAQACEATHVQRVAGEELLELRMACLDRRALQARATMELMAQADDGVAARSAQAVRSLPPVEPCLDTERLREGPAPLPEALAAPAAELRELVARSWAFDVAGRAAQGLDAAEHAVSEAERLGPEGEPLLAETLHNRGRLYRTARRLDEARRDLEAVLQVAEHGGDQTLALDALQELLLVAYDDADRSAFGAWLVVARGKLRRFEDQPHTRAQLHHLEGLLALREGEGTRAVASFEMAAGLYRELGSGVELDLGRTLLQLGVAQGRLGHEAEAEEAFESARTLAEREGLLPLLAEVHQERGRMHFDRGRLEPAEQWLRRALELRVAFDGATAALTIPTRVPLAMLLQQRGELSAAVAMAQAARDSLSPSVPAGSHAQVMSLLARFHRQQGDWEAALDDYQRVEEALAATPSPDPIEQAMLDSNVADCLRIMGRRDAARTRYERALESLRIHAAADDYRRVYPLFGLGSLLAQQHDRQGAASLLRRALAIQEATPKDLDIGATLRWELGRVVLDDAAATPSERAEALGLVRAAQDQFRAFDDGPMVAEIAAFLDRCGSRCAETPEVP
jgi:serine/threonine protein kinase/tetratricopeptide (TPR) repeat protein